MPAERGRLGPALLLILLAAALAVAAFVYRERTPDLALEVPRVTKGFDPGQGQSASITFFVRFDEPDALVEIIGRNRRPVRTLARSQELRAGERVTYEWDGRTNEGTRALPGPYRLRVVLPEQGRDMVFIRQIEVRRASSAGGGS